METRDMAEIVETFRTKFMEGAAGTAGRVADACAGLVATPGGMAPHDMELENARFVGIVLDSLSAMAVTTAAAPDDSEMAAASRSELAANGRQTTSVHLQHGHSINPRCRHFSTWKKKRKGRSRRGEPANGPPRTGWGSSPTTRRCSATPLPQICLSESHDATVSPSCAGNQHVRHPGATHLPSHRQP